MEDAIYMANVWKLIRKHGWEYFVLHGDVDAVDFVANRILANSSAQAVGQIHAESESENERD